MNILKKKGKVIRSQVTRFPNDADKIFSSTSAFDLEAVSVLIEHLRLAERQLKDAYTAIEPYLREEDAEAEFATVLAYRDKLATCIGEYIKQLRSAYATKQAKGREPKVGDVELVQEDLPRIFRKADIIVSLFPGRVGEIRSCEVRTRQGKHVGHPVQRLYPLEISEL
ncbi:hypothetical protein MRX96_000482 [Rhipicephalus microplus]